MVETIIHRVDYVSDSEGRFRQKLTGVAEETATTIAMTESELRVALDRFVGLNEFVGGSPEAEFINRELTNSRGRLSDSIDPTVINFAMALLSLTSRAAKEFKPKSSLKRTLILLLRQFNP